CLNTFSFGVRTKSDGDIDTWSADGNFDEARAIATQIIDPPHQGGNARLRKARRASGPRRSENVCSTKPLSGWSVLVEQSAPTEAHRGQHAQAKSRTVWRSVGARSHRGLRAPIRNILPPISDNERPSPSLSSQPRTTAAMRIGV